MAKQHGSKPSVAATSALSQVLGASDGSKHERTAEAILGCVPSKRALTPADALCASQHAGLPEARPC